jgi:multicomponent Na+:H+ antiporter subunit E
MPGLVITLSRLGGMISVRSATTRIIQGGVVAKPRQQFPGLAASWRPIIVRLMLFAAIWWLLTGGSTKTWGLGAVVVIAALIMSLRLLPPGPHHISLAALFTFSLFFVVRSVIAGTQVASFALRPRMDLRPAMLNIPLRLEHEPERVFLASTLSLLPGTLTTGLEGRMLHLHVLDKRMPVEEEVREVERRVARLFCVELA